MAKKKTRELAPAERLLIERRRSGESQAAAAKRYRVSLYQYRRWEDGEEPAPDLAGEKVGELQPFEACFLARLRAGLSSAELAEALKISRWWLTQMEHGRAPADRLIEAWRARRGA